MSKQSKTLRFQGTTYTRVVQYIQVLESRRTRSLDPLPKANKSQRSQSQKESSSVPVAQVEVHRNSLVALHPLDRLLLLQHHNREQCLSRGLCLSQCHNQLPPCPTVPIMQEMNPHHRFGRHLRLLHLHLQPRLLLPQSPRLRHYTTSLDNRRASSASRRVKSYW